MIHIMNHKLTTSKPHLSNPINNIIIYNIYNPIFFSIPIYIQSNRMSTAVIVILSIIAIIILFNLSDTTEDFKIQFPNGKDYEPYCRSCSHKNKPNCLNCANCGYCINPDGTAKCMKGDSEGPYGSNTCAYWQYNKSNAFPPEYQYKYPFPHTRVYPGKCVFPNGHVYPRQVWNRS